MTTNKTKKAENVENANKATTNKTSEEKTIVKRKGVVIATRTIDNDPKRIVIELDCESFESIKPNGEVIDTTSFSKDTIELLKQIGSKVELLDLANTLANGKRVNKSVIALCLKNAEIEIEREFHTEGETRNTGNESDVYANDTYTTKVISVKANIAPAFQQVLMSMILDKSQLLDADTTAAANMFTNVKPNPFML